MMHNGKKVFRIRPGIVMSKTTEDRNRWVYDHQEDKGKTTVMRNVFDEHSFLHIPIASFAATMKHYVDGERNDEEDIL